ncbi:NAC domain-containing protein 2-like [Spinacia oleracea]|uniref:NAC domain-containing protein 2-like n=1 Tax=Spinacia oleracea TaxID=3562 RepID=A0A9R0HZI8_SPIOL|nr:NAC domain-containing protein 2-like [Spinacia oleracea]
MEQQQLDPSMNLALQKSELFYKDYSTGFRFYPHDEELISVYLEPKIKCEILPKNLMHEVNIYKYHPSFLAEHLPPQGERDWYFFTSRDKKYKNGLRPDRKAGNGYWKATGADKEIRDKSNKIIGYRRSLVYYEGKPKVGDKTDWIMHEFRVEGPSKVHRNFPTEDIGMRLDDWVLCRIYKKEKKKASRPKKASVGKKKKREESSLSAVPVIIKKNTQKNKKNPRSSSSASVSGNSNNVDVAVNINVQNNTISNNVVNFNNAVNNNNLIPANLSYNNNSNTVNFNGVNNNLIPANLSYNNDDDNNNNNYEYGTSSVWNNYGNSEDMYYLVMQEANGLLTPSLPPNLNQIMELPAQ